MAIGMTISRAAEQAGVGVETVRFYERRGLIEQPTRPRSGGYRFYDNVVVERIRFIRQAQELGFSLREIEELISLRADPAADCADVRAQAVAKRIEVDRKITQLRDIRAALDELIATCPGGGALKACTIIDALSQRSIGDAGVSSGQYSFEAPGVQQPIKEREVKTIDLKIVGMHCDGCARTVEAVVSAEAGVRKASVSFKQREARILFDPQTISEDRLAEAIRQAGYAIADES